jgi:hypothetical protein
MTKFSRVAIAMVGMTGLAAAQPKADTKPAAMPDMKPPAEVAEVAKAASGTWKCKGQGMDHTMKMADLAGTLKVKLDLDGWWIHSSFESNMGKEPFHFESFATFDASAKKWKRLMAESGGGWSAGGSDGVKDKKVDWDLTMHSPMGDAPFRDHEDMSDPKAGVKMSGEFSMDGGKSWIQVYNMVCKK